MTNIYKTSSKSSRNSSDNSVWIYIANNDFFNSTKELPEDRIKLCAEEYASNFGITGKFDSILRTDKGKPYFEEAPDLHFSISHSGDYWVSAFSLLPIGVDVQKIRACNIAQISKRFFHIAEYKVLQNIATISGEEACHDAFFKIWTAKESYVKLTGTGIGGAFKSFYAANQEIIVGNSSAASFKFIPFDPDYKLCVCSKNIKDINCIKL